MDTAEHMFTKCKQLMRALTPSSAEILADLLYEMGRGLLVKRDYELAIRWLERAYDVLSEQDAEALSPETGELRLSIMQSIGWCTSLAFEESALTPGTVQAYMKLKTPEARNKAWNMMQLLEAVSTPFLPGAVAARLYVYG